MDDGQAVPRRIETRVTGSGRHEGEMFLPFVCRPFSSQ
jgi:hypothetical protein